LGKDVTLHEFGTKMKEYGTITDLVICEDRETRESRGFGFVEYSVGLFLLISKQDWRAVNLVLEDFYKITIKGRWVECKKA
jgi:hypothetical protein